MADNGWKRLVDELPEMWRAAWLWFDSMGPPPDSPKPGMMLTWRRFEFPSGDWIWIDADIKKAATNGFASPIWRDEEPSLWHYAPDSLLDKAGDQSSRA